MPVTTSDRWLVCPRPAAQAALRLFCFPHAGGGPAVFHRWPQSLPASIEVYAAQLPGRGARFGELPYTRMEPLLEALLIALRPLLDRPYALFGHSLGALLAFEVVRALHREGGRPEHLFASACPAPQLLPKGETLHAMPRKQFLEALRRLKGTPPELFAEEAFMDLMLPTLRADLALFETYEYGEAPPLTCGLTITAGQDDPQVSTEELEAWRRQAGGRFNLHLFAGDHFYLNDRRSELLRLIGRDLAPYYSSPD